GFQGRRHDEETGLIYFRNRYLDPHTGRFLTYDLKGSWFDVPNVGNGFAFAGSKPTLAADPYGLAACLAGCPCAGPAGDGSRRGCPRSLRTLPQGRNSASKRLKSIDLFFKKYFTTINFLRALRGRPPLVSPSEGYFGVLHCAWHCLIAALFGPQSSLAASLIWEAFEKLTFRPPLPLREHLNDLFFYDRLGDYCASEAARRRNPLACLTCCGRMAVSGPIL
ncbi:MAG: hypothetical protein D6790_10105, partial [Caldilineae bacterium]